MKVFRCFCISALSSLLTAAAWSDNTPVLASVARNVQHVEECLANGQYGEAQAYAEMTLLSRTVKYSTTNDESGVVRQALDLWQSTLGGQVTFVEAPANMADLQIEFKPNISMSGRDVMGLATTRRNVTTWSGGYYTYRVSGSLEIATLAPDRLPVTRDVMLNTTLHEVGHFLGLDDCGARGDVMGPIDLKHPVTAPSSSDLARLTTVRIQTNLLLQQAIVQTPTLANIGR